MCMQLALSDERTHLNTFLAQMKRKRRAVLVGEKTLLTKLLTVHKRPGAKLYFTSSILLQCPPPNPPKHPPPLCVMSKWEPHACIQRPWSKLRRKIKVQLISHLTGEHNCLKWPHALQKPTWDLSRISAKSSGLFLACLQFCPESLHLKKSHLWPVAGKVTVFLLHV